MVEELSALQTWLTVTSSLLWGRIAGGVLIALAVADIVAFIFEWREHRKWTRAAIAEAFALALLRLLGFADWHRDSLQANDDHELRTRVAALDGELEPFRKIAQSEYPSSDGHGALLKLASEVTTLAQRADAQEAKATALTRQVADAEQRASAQDAKAAALTRQVADAEQRADAQDAKAAALTRQVADAEQRASPPTLSLGGQEVVSNGNARVVTMQFIPSKNQMLGQLHFQFALPVGSPVQITDVWPPSGRGAPFTSGPDSKKILENGRLATLTYALMSSGTPLVELKLSGPTPIQITGEYIASPIVLNVN